MNCGYSEWLWRALDCQFGGLPHRHSFVQHSPAPSTQRHQAPRRSTRHCATSHVNGNSVPGSIDTDGLSCRTSVVRHPEAMPPAITELDSVRR